MATKLFAKPSSTHLALFGAGAQILYHARLIIYLFPSITHCTIVNRRINDRLSQLVNNLQSEFPGVTFNSGSFTPDPATSSAPNSFDLEATVQSADIICTATPSTTSLFRSEWVKPGTHLNLVGSYTPQMREIDDDLVRRAGLVLVDSREACLAEAGEIISTGLTNAELVELGELVNSQGETEHEKCQGVKDAGAVTIFKSVGVGIQDSAIVSLVVKRAEELGIGSRVSYD